MFFNLVENAVKYNHPGGTVKVDVQQQDGQVVIHVADTGRGTHRSSGRVSSSPFSAWTSPSAVSLAERGLAFRWCGRSHGFTGGRVWVEESTGSGAYWP